MAGTKDRSVDFADLGVDALFVDESHEFKNLAYVTSMNVSGLGNITGSAKALDLYIKCRYLQEKNQGRGVYFMTGTPISNTIAEVYTLQRYLQYGELQNKGIEYFDTWASTFGQITAGWELDATGVNYKLKSRFASFQNVPELLAMYRSFADVVTKSDLDAIAKAAGLRPLTPPLAGGKPYNHVVERSADQAAYMEHIIDRMEHLPKDPRIDNPLAITNDARKAGLDYRLIDPEAEDYPGSKANAAVERIFRIWQDTSEDKGTQLVFCDLSTPKGGFSSKAKPETEELVLEFEEDDTFAGDEDPAPDAELVEEGDDNGEDSSVAKDMDDLMAQGSGKFSVYDDMKRKLVAKGIPADEIAYIHDANTDLRKAKLFSDMQAGRVRILMGSTFKMGAGMNVQRRLVAAHHLDAPWRPSDLEQRNGRIIRQGNAFYERDPDNFSVSVYYYATKQTYDSRMWQTIEWKANAIEQFRKGDLLQRVIDDVQSEAANAAEMKAAASGNPLILLQVQLASDLRKLEALNSQHQRSQHRLKDRLKWLSSAQERLAKAENTYIENCNRRDTRTNTFMDKGNKRILLEFIVNGKILREKDKEQIMDALRGGVKSVTREQGKNFLIGSYRGFDVSMRRWFSASGPEGFRFVIGGSGNQDFQPDNLVYSFDDKFSLSGFFQRLDNFLDKGLAQAFETYKGNVAHELAELATVKAALGQDFPHKAELDVTRENHAAVMRELQRMQNEPGYVSTWEPKTVAGAREAAPESVAELSLPVTPVAEVVGTPVPLLVAEGLDAKGVASEPAPYPDAQTAQAPEPSPGDIAKQILADAQRDFEDAHKNDEGFFKPRFANSQEHIAAMEKAGPYMIAEREQQAKEIIAALPEERREPARRLWDSMPKGLYDSPPGNFVHMGKAVIERNYGVLYGFLRNNDNKICKQVVEVLTGCKLAPQMGERLRQLAAMYPEEEAARLEGRQKREAQAEAERMEKIAAELAQARWRLPDGRTLPGDDAAREIVALGGKVVSAKRGASNRYYLTVPPENRCFPLTKVQSEYVEYLVRQRSDEPSSPVEAKERQPQVETPERVVHQLTFGDRGGSTKYSIFDEPEARVLRRTHYNDRQEALGQTFYDDDKWHTTATAPRGVYPKRFDTLDEAMTVARQDAAQRGFEGAQTKAFETTPLKSPPPPKANYHSILADAGFWPTGGSFYGKDEHKTTIYSTDGGEFNLWVFKYQDAKVGLCAQYEKDDIIDASRTVRASFDTLGEALDFAGGYKKFAEQPKEADKAAGMPLKQEMENVPPRMRMR